MPFNLQDEALFHVSFPLIRYLVNTQGLEKWLNENVLPLPWILYFVTCSALHIRYNENQTSVCSCQ